MLAASPEVSVGRVKHPCDVYLLTALAGLVILGLVMVASASVTAAEKEGRDTLYFLWRQTVSVGLGLGVAYAGLRTPTRVLCKLSTFALFLAIALLAAVLVPGLGVESHGAMRWLRVGPVSFQPSELAKVLAILYLAGFIDRHAEAVRATTSGLLLPDRRLGDRLGTPVCRARLRRHGGADRHDLGDAVPGRGLDEPVSWPWVPWPAWPS